MAPLYLRAHSSDNVGIVVDTEGAFEGESGGYGLVVCERIPQAQKIALVDWPRAIRCSATDMSSVTHPRALNGDPGSGRK